ncbi:hypothetical protein AB0K05_31840 [Nonomuraea sp. NPDC049486]|uniref:hypothetical protein n=1 Tax=Nonomuraea sp. NPDC049486 TaxID=3155773 RepID=UPI0034487480
MLTQEHEFLIELVRHRPSLVATLLAEVGLKVPAFKEARLESADLNDCRPTEYRADSVVAMVDDKRVFAVVLEVQRRYDRRKHWSWPVYLATLRARLKCPCVLLVFCPDAAEARRCATHIDMGHPGWILCPVVVGPEQVPMITDIARAIAEPELTALSAVVHGDGDEGLKVLQVLHDSQQHLSQEQRSYSDLVLALLPESVVTKFREIAVAVLDEIKHPWVRGWIAHGESLGEAKGEAKAILMVLETRGLEVSDETRERILGCTDQETLEAWIHKAVTVRSVEELFVVSGA